MMWDKIDFNAALEDCKRVRDGIKSDEDFQNADSGLVMYYLNTIIQALESATIVKHGHWINHFDDLFPEESTIECSVCHEHSPDDMPHDNFCPNCGSYNGGDEK